MAAVAAIREERGDTPIQQDIHFKIVDLNKLSLLVEKFKKKGKKILILEAGGLNYDKKR